MASKPGIVFGIEQVDPEGTLTREEYYQTRDDVCVEKCADLWDFWGADA